jgi:hypothetical protein
MTWLGVPFFILIGVGIAILIFILLQRDIRKVKSNVTPANHRKLVYLYILQVGGLGATEIGIAICIFLPIVVLLPQSNSLGISMATFLNEFVDILPLAGLVVFGILIAGFILSLSSRPMLGGFINLAIPLIVFMIYLTALFLVGSFFEDIAGLFVGPIIGIGIGQFIWFALCIGQISFGIFKRKYLKKLRVPSA